MEVKQLRNKTKKNTTTPSIKLSEEKRSEIYNRELTIIMTVEDYNRYVTDK